MRVFVTGATGFIGSFLIPELINAGHHVVGLEQPKRISDDLHLPEAGNGLTLTGHPHIAASGGSRHGPPG